MLNVGLIIETHIHAISWKKVHKNTKLQFSCPPEGENPYCIFEFVHHKRLLNSKLTSPPLAIIDRE